MPMNELKIKLPSSVAWALDRLRDAGFEAYAVGGCVRDSLLGRAPNDWDITTSALPEEVKAVFSDSRLIETGLKHGTVTVLYEREPLEITTYRNDGEYADNRHPVAVRFSDTLEEDLARRDFTVNAMAYAPEVGLVDLFGGRADLEAGIIRCVGDPETRFREDGLRILRAVRFASVLDFEIDPETDRALHAWRVLLRNISFERIREEFCKLLCGPGAMRILRAYVDLLEPFLPEAAPTVGFLQNSKYHHLDVWEHTLAALSMANQDLVTRLVLFLHDIGKPHVYTEDAEGGHFKGHGAVSAEIADRVMQRLRFDNATRARVVLLVEHHDRPLSAEPKRLKRWMRQLSDEDILRMCEIQRCDRLAHAEGYATPSEELERIPEAIRAIRAEESCLHISELAVGGRDLMAIGIPSGPRLGQILEALLEDVIEERLPNEKEALLAKAKTMDLI